MSVTPADAIEVADDLTSSAKVVKAIKDNQLLTAVILFILWQMDILSDVVGMTGCGF